MCKDNMIDYERLEESWNKLKQNHKEIHNVYSFKKDKIEKIIELEFNLDVYYALRINRRFYQAIWDGEWEVFMELKKEWGEMSIISSFLKKFKRDYEKL